MAYEIPGKMITLPAGADLSAAQYHFVVASGDTAVLAGNGVPVLGVLQNKPSSGQAASIMIDGVTKVIAGASTMAAGDFVASSSAGKAAVVAATEYTVGTVLFGSSGSTGRVLTVALSAIGST